MALRIGLGFDAHRFSSNRKLILAGVEIAYPLGLSGHSDADVATHAIIDALFGASALGDIGEFFPDSSPEYKNISSINLLIKARKIVAEHQYSVKNIDLTVILQKPKLNQYRQAMRESLSKALELDISQISIKATTTEGMGFTGKEEGIAALAICLLENLPLKS